MMPNKTSEKCKGWQKGEKKENFEIKNISLTKVYLIVKQKNSDVYVNQLFCPTMSVFRNMYEVMQVMVMMRWTQLPAHPGVLFSVWD